MSLNLKLELPKEKARVTHYEWNLAAPFFQQARAKPGQTALVLRGGTVTYQELGDLALQIAAWLRRQGEPVARVGILASRCLEAYAGILAANVAGAAYVPLNPKLPEARLKAMIENADLQVLIVEASLVDSVCGTLVDGPTPVILAPARQRGTKRIHGGDVLAELPVEGVLAPLEKNDLAYIIYTSGTTGTPKGVMVSVGNVRQFIEVMQQRYGLTAEDRVSQFFEITFDPSVFDLYMAWEVGASVHVVPHEQVMAPADYIREQALTIWFSVPSAVAILRQLKRLQPGSLPSLRLSLFAGEPLPLASARAWMEAAPNSRVENLYGPTETTVDCLLETLSEPIRATPERDIVAIGLPYPGTLASIVDASLQFQPQGTHGELAIAGEQVAMGYWRNPPLTAQRFVQLSHPVYGQQKWYLTGDLAYEDEDGHYHHLGRTDHQIKFMGHRIELEEIETHLRRACGKDTVAAVAWPVEQGIVHGIVGCICDCPQSPTDLRKALSAILPAYMVPTQIIALEYIPLTSNGKTDRKAIVEMLEQRRGA